MSDFFIRISDPEAEAMLRKIAADDFRTIAASTILIIRKEWVTRYGETAPVLPASDEDQQPLQHIQV